MELPKYVKHNDSRIIHLHYQTQYELTSTFVRLQEFYESPFSNIRGNYFTLDEFMDSYVAAKGEFSYFSDWGGFNVPGNAVIDFCDTFANEYRENGYRQKEHDLLYHINNNEEKFIYNRNKDFYVIGTFGNDVDDATSCMEHELAHAYFYLSAEYNSIQRLNYNALPGEIKAKVGVTLTEMGYDESVIEDEVQAYFSTDERDVLRDRFNLTETELEWQQRFIDAYMFQKTYTENPA